MVGVIFSFRVCVTKGGRQELLLRMASFKRIIEKVLLHAILKTKYTVRKMQYCFASVSGMDSKNNIEKMLMKCLPSNYTPTVFLKMSLEEIDNVIQSNQELHALIMREGECSYNNEWIILNSRRKDMFDAKSGHYRWTEDFFTKFQYKSCFYMDARRQAILKGTDVKVPWEIARMQSLFSLGLAYRASTNEKYVSKIIDIIRDFVICCPYKDGVNWNVSMEVSIRISNILLACELVKDSQLFDESFKRLLAQIVYEHMIHIRKNIENEKDGGNHLLADILGLAVTSAAMPFLPGASDCAAYAQKMIHKELMRQVLADGGHFEGSVSYHRLVGEILCFSVLAQQKLGFSLTSEENERLLKMGEFTHSLRMPNGLVPQFGDNDSGRVFQLTNENTRDHDSFINLVTTVVSGRIVYPNKKDGFFVFAPEDTLVDRKLFPAAKICEYPYFKLIKVQNNNLYLAFCGMTPELVNKVGHSHNDLLSFWLTVGDEEFIVDPGSGEYTGNIEVRNKLRSVNNHSTVSIDRHEQRQIPDDPTQVFMWRSTAESSLNCEQRQNDIRIKGKCSYILPSGKLVTHERIIDMVDNRIRFHDIVSDLEKECSISLPILPGREVKIDKNIVSIFGKEYAIRISGSWLFSKDNSCYAQQYKTVVKNNIIHGISNLKENWMQIHIYLRNDL